jgi:hypothetical protein
VKLARAGGVTGQELADCEDIANEEPAPAASVKKPAKKNRKRMSSSLVLENSMTMNPGVNHQALARLRFLLDRFSPGEITDTLELADLLARCWSDLDGGDEGGMEGYKLRDRMEKVSWQPPALAFTIERHGDTVLDSRNVELQRWNLNLDVMTAKCCPGGVRLLCPFETRLDAMPLVQKVAESIFTRRQNECLEWDGDKCVRVLVSKIIPEAGLTKLTLARRRKRFRIALGKQLKEAGWKQIRRDDYWKA